MTKRMLVSDNDHSNPLAEFIFTIVGLTNRGLVRATNQDAFIADIPIAIVADGMGGHADGQLAAETIVSIFNNIPTVELPTQNTIQQAISTAHSEISGINAQGRKPGSTLTGTAIGLQGNTLVWQIFNVGDSRTYRYNTGDFTQITVDHSEVQELVATGQLTLGDAQTYKHKNVITRALGGGYSEIPIADFWAFPITAGDQILLCSDGLTGMVPDASIKAILDQNLDPTTTVEQLITLALENGGRDNVTVVLAQAYANPDFVPALTASSQADFAALYDDITADKVSDSLQ